jgi:leader peptidase (prepilin peptidase)/N-methyltransferase
MFHYVLLIVGGIFLGAIINWAIYAWAIFLKRPISPWMKPAEGASPRTLLDRIPIIGWPGRQRDLAIHGKAFWVRPFLIEIGCAIFVPWFYYWQSTGGLTGGDIPAEGIAALANLWFWGQGILLALICIGTFIDFDEKTIPDQVTVTGTIIALLIAAFAPAFRLPQPAVFGMATAPTIAPLDYASPGELPNLHLGLGAMAIALAIYAIWIWALLPKLPVWYVGFRKSCRFMVAYAIQPKRKTSCELRTKDRATPGLTIILGVLFVLGMIAIPVAWTSGRLPPLNQASLFGAFVGLAFGGGMVWAIRIVGTYALQKEAMGFGDVTLHAMIGAFLGWQAALLIFVIAPFAALLVVLLQFVLTRQSVVAFGPYLSAATVILLFNWAVIWPRAAQGVFANIPLLFATLAVCLVLMAAMLAVIAWFKGMFSAEETEKADA